jgi:hypothetical protein
MLQIPIKDWVLLFGGSILAICFGFLSSLTVELFLRAQELQICIKQIEFKNDESKLKTELKNALTTTNALGYKTVLGFLVFILCVVLYITFGFLLGSPTDTQATNVSNICENCSYQTNNYIINNTYNLTEIKCQNNEVSVKEMKYFIQKRYEST